MRPPILLAAVIALLAIGLASCGGKSDAEQAQDDACGAVSDIGTHVNKLRNYTITTVTSDKVKADVNAIKADLKTIKGALPDLNSSLKSQLQTATNEFSSKLSEIASGLGSSISLQSASNQLIAAQNQLKKSYDQAFASVSC
jgi:phosphoglycerate-specific signal transduction histidine kinase